MVNSPIDKGKIFGHSRFQYEKQSRVRRDSKDKNSCGDSMYSRVQHYCSKCGNNNKECSLNEADMGFGKYKKDLNCNQKEKREHTPYEKEEILAIRSRFPTKVPVIVRKFTWDKELPLLDKSKFLVPQDITMSQFQMIIRNRMQLHPNKALYLLVNDRSLISSSMTVAQVYKEFGDQDGYLYVTYASQESFGGGTTSDPKENFNQ